MKDASSSEKIRGFEKLLNFFNLNSDSACLLLLDSNIDQWDSSYPNKNVISEDIKNQDEVTEASAPVANKGVVTPDKDPVPKSLASVDKASDSTKPSKKRKGDQDKKDAPQKLSASYDEETENEEDVVVEDLTKMEALRKIIEELKGFDRGVGYAVISHNCSLTWKHK